MFATKNKLLLSFKLHLLLYGIQTINKFIRIRFTIMTESTVILNVMGLKMISIISNRGSCRKFIKVGQALKTINIK